MYIISHYRAKVPRYVVGVKTVFIEGTLVRPESLIRIKFLKWETVASEWFSWVDSPEIASHFDRAEALSFVSNMKYQRVRCYSGHYYIQEIMVDPTCLS